MSTSNQGVKGNENSETLYHEYLPYYHISLKSPSHFPFCFSLLNFFSPKLKFSFMKERFFQTEAIIRKNIKKVIDKVR